jgi:hypothetical protein
VNPLTRREDEEELGLFELLVAAELGALHWELGTPEEDVVNVGGEGGEEARGLRHEAQEFRQWLLPEAGSQVTFGVGERESPLTAKVDGDLEGHLLRTTLEGPWTQNRATDQDGTLK